MVWSVVMKTMVIIYENTQLEDKKDFEESKKNQNFCQWFDKTGLEVARLNLKNPTAISIMHFLTVNMTKKNAVVCSVKALEDFIGVKRSTVYKSIKFLKDNNLVKIVELSGVNIFIFNKDYVWKSWANAKGLQFDADVILSEKEISANLLKYLGYDDIARVNVVNTLNNEKKDKEIKKNTTEILKQNTNKTNSDKLPEDILDDILVDDNTDLEALGLHRH